MVKRFLAVCSIALMCGCETGYALSGEVVPDRAVDRSRQLLVFLSEEVDRSLSQPLRPAPDMSLLKAVERIDGDKVPFGYGTLGCPRRVQIIALAPKARIALADLGNPGGPSVEVGLGDYVAKTALLSTAEGCGTGRETQRITVSLSADEWSGP